MKQRFIVFLAAFFVLAALLPAQAGTWRSTTGNMFHFYPGGAMEAYVQGRSYNGNWWWTRSPYQFQYNIYGFGGTCTVNIKGQGAIASYPGQAPSYWSQLGSRGRKTDKPDTTSWFMTTIDP